MNGLNDLMIWNGVKITEILSLGLKSLITNISLISSIIRNSQCGMHISDPITTHYKKHIVLL